MLASHPIIRAFERVSFQLGSRGKRFAQEMLGARPDYELTKKQEDYVWSLAFKYRRQIPAAILATARGQVEFSTENSATKPNTPDPTPSTLTKLRTFALEECE